MKSNYEPQLLKLELRNKLKIMRKYFISDAKARGVSKETIRSYRCHIKPFIKYLLRKSLSPDVVGPNEIKHFIQIQLNRDKSFVSINDYIRMIKLFYKSILEEYCMSADPSKNIKYLKVIKKRKIILQHNEVVKIMNRCPKDTFLGMRNRIIIRLMWDAALRRNEIVNIKMDEIDLYNKRIGIIGKGKRFENVYLSENTTKELYEYIKLRPRGAMPYLIVNTKGNIFHKDSLSHLVKRLGKSEGFNIGPHTFRHSAITWYAKEGMPPLYLQAFARHQDIATTMKYVREAEIAKGLPEQLRQYSAKSAL
jgi:site-specific recombinase XerD